MNEILSFLLYLFIMAGVTYLVRMIPLVFCRKRIESRFIRSFLYYVPYTVLAAMTVPAIFYSTGTLLSAILGTVVAVILSYFGKSLVTVAASSAFAVLVTEFILKYV